MFIYGSKKSEMLELEKREAIGLFSLKIYFLFIPPFSFLLAAYSIIILILIISRWNTKIGSQLQASTWF
jgi:hypothetical protein